MKHTCRLFALSVLCCIQLACSKSNHSPSGSASASSLSFSANDSLIKYSINLAYIQDVDSLHTTLISGQYADTASVSGSLSIRLIGDTTGMYRGDSLLVTYTDGAGSLYYNTSDSSNFVKVDKFPKINNGVVSGSFSMTVSGTAGTIRFTNGSFNALYQY